MLPKVGVVVFVAVFMVSLEGLRAVAGNDGL